MQTHVFKTLARAAAYQGGMPHRRFVFVPQPVMGKSPAELRAYIDGADAVSGRPFMEEVLDALAKPLSDEEQQQIRFDRSTPRLVGPETEEDLHQLFLENNWTDKLPIVLPTEERVARMLASTSHAPDFHARSLGIHGREGGGQRGDGRGESGILPGDSGAGGQRSIGAG